MDIMNSKKTLLSLINGGILGAPAGGSTVKFMYTTNLATAAGNTVAGGLVFANDGQGHAAIWSNGTILSSAIQSVVPTNQTNAKHGGKTVTITFINATSGAIQTEVFNVIDEAGLEAYFAGSKTIALTGTDSSIFEVKTDGKTILVDNALGLKSGLKIAYIDETASTTGEALIALTDNDDTILNSINVSSVVGDGVLKDSIYHQDTNILELRFGNGKVYDADDPTTYTKVDINLQKLIDINDVFIGNDSSIYLDATLDASTVTLNTKMQDPSTASANATGLADAWKVKQYVDSKSSDLSVEITSRNAYIEASVGTGDDNKHIYIEAEAADLTVTSGSGDSTISGTANKLVDGADAAAKVQTFVNARIAEEVAKLDASIDSTAGTFISAGVAEVDGKITSVVVHETVGSITGTDSEITGSEGLISGDDVADAVSTFVNGRLDASIQALDANVSTAESLNPTNGIYTRGTLTEVDGVVTAISVENQIAVTNVTDYDPDTSTAPTFSVTTDGLLTNADATKLAHYVDEVADMIKAQSIESLDASISDTDAPNFISTHIEQKDGKIIVSTVDSSYGAYSYNAETHAFGTATNGLAKVADTQTFVQNVIESLDLVSTAANASANDASNFVKTTISETDGIVKNESVEVTYATVTATPGDITVTQNGIVKGDVLEAAIEGALKWTVLE